MCEGEAIVFMSRMRGIEAHKNLEHFENEWMTGTPDILMFNHGRDIKCPWDDVTFLNSIMEERLNGDYWWQAQGYMCLTASDSWAVDYCLMNTPADVNFGEEVSFDQIPDDERIFSYYVEFNAGAIDKLIKRVDECRAWLDEWDLKVKSRFRKM